MLRAILAAIRDAGRPMCVADLSRVLGLDESALEGMLETLIARGRLRAIVFEDAGCTACPVKGGCFIMNDGVAKTYALLAPTSSVPADRAVADRAAASRLHGSPAANSPGRPSAGSPPPGSPCAQAIPSRRATAPDPTVSCRDVPAGWSKLTPPPSGRAGWTSARAHRSHCPDGRDSACFTAARQRSRVGPGLPPVAPTPSSLARGSQPGSLCRPHA